MNNELLEERWKAAVLKIESRFGEGLDLQGILFLIGINELGKGRQKLSKNQKLDVLHIAVCKLLEPYGFYEYTGKDKDGWPHYQRTNKLPHLKPMEQEKLMKEAIATYIEEG